jgi:hypothetical protein
MIVNQTYGVPPGAVQTAAKSPIRDQTSPREVLKAVASSFRSLGLTPDELARKTGQSQGVAGRRTVIALRSSGPCSPPASPPPLDRGTYKESRHGHRHIRALGRSLFRPAGDQPLIFAALLVLIAVTLYIFL